MAEKEPRSGRITLRVPPRQHAELSGLAKVLGLDINGLLRLMINRSIDHYRLEAQLLLEQAQENMMLLDVWKQYNPGKPIREFWDHYIEQQKALKQKRAFEAFMAFDFDARDRETKG